MASETLLLQSIHILNPLEERKKKLTNVELAGVHEVLLLGGSVGAGKSQGVHDALAGALL